MLSTASTSTLCIHIGEMPFAIENCTRQMFAKMKCFRCCKMHDWCYDATDCVMFSEYFVPYYWRCYHGYKPVCGSFVTIFICLLLNTRFSSLMKILLIFVFLNERHS